MSLLDFKSYLIKYKRFLAFLIAASVVLCTIVVKANQSYSAQAYIHFIDEKALDGYAPDMTELNIYEITNSEVVKTALDNCGLDGVSVESVRKSISIAPVLATYEEEKYASFIENFSSYDESEENKATVVYYRVKYTTNKGEDFAREVLNAVMDAYKEYYVQNHAYNSDIVRLSFSDISTYDYYEAVELLADKIKKDSSTFSLMAAGDVDYRSPKTGYSLNDISAMYKDIYNEYIGAITEDILENAISKNRDDLITKYTYRADNSLLKSKENADMADSQSELMKLYSQKNQEYLWDENNTYGYGSESAQVREEVERDSKYSERKSVYDTIALSFVDHLAKSKDLIIDKEHYESIIDRFGADTGRGYSSDAQTEEKIKQLYDEYALVSEIAEITVSDYNLFASSRYLTPVSGIATHENISEIVYYSLAIVVAVGFGVICIVLCELRKKKRI